LHRPPNQSGGQQQRIALAHALAVEPKVLLLDEPLSVLDAKVRVTLRNEIRRIQQQLKMTAIYVTHDQEEALAISDRIAVMAKGKIEQLDQPEEIYSNPHTVFAATFVGSSNQFRGVLQSAATGLFKVGNFILQVPSTTSLHDGDHVLVIVRPEEMSIADGNQIDNTDGHSTSNYIGGIIELRTFLGPFTRFHVHVNETTTLTADVPSQQARDFYVAQKVVLSFLPEACQVLPLEMGEAELKRMQEAEKV
jgi:putative spermidine/putrescine transport system ATP-binding protein